MLAVFDEELLLYCHPAVLYMAALLAIVGRMLWLAR